MRIIVGAGGHGRECLGVWRAASRSAGVESPLRDEPIAFVDDRMPDREVLGRIDANWVGSLDTLREQEPGTPIRYLVGIGDGNVRESVVSKLPESWIAEQVVHPSACLDSDVRVCEGAVIFAQATVTTNIAVGRHVHIGRGSAVGHDSVLGDFSTIMPLASISGNVYIGKRSTVGSGAVIRQGQYIGDDSYVGAGAVVVSDVADGTIVVGNPARVLRRR